MVANHKEKAIPIRWATMDKMESQSKIHVEIIEENCNMGGNK